MESNFPWVRSWEVHSFSLIIPFWVWIPETWRIAYASYWEQNVNHTLINRQYCIENPKNFKGYSADCWGLTASDNHQFYSAHSPTNDLGVITPTAAISSIPYTPEYSLTSNQALLL